MNPHLLGAILLIIGLGFSYWQIWLPLQAARHHATEVSYESRGQFIGVFCTLIGLAKLVLGEKFNLQNQNFRRDWRFWALTLLGVGLAIGMDFLMKNELRKYGYSVH